MKPRSERDKRYEEKHKNERKAKNVVWGTSISSSIFRLILGFAEVIALISAYDKVVSSMSSASLTVISPFSICEMKRCLFSRI